MSVARQVSFAFPIESDDTGAAQVFRLRLRGRAEEVHRRSLEVALNRWLMAAVSYNDGRHQKDQRPDSDSSYQWVKLIDSRIRCKRRSKPYSFGRFLLTSKQSAAGR